MSTAIYFVPEGYTTQGPRLMGRHAAGESFLRGFLSYGQPGDLWVQVERPEDAEAFLRVARQLGRQDRVLALGRHDLRGLSQAGGLYLPGPGLAEHAWFRSAYGHQAWSLCGITHTTSSAGAMDAIANLLVAPVQPWDALICTSNAVKDNVQRVLDAQVEYLTDRLGMSKQVMPLLPVIPLGIHADDFVYTDQQRKNARAFLRAKENTIIVTFVGRLSFHAKAHPLAMYQALERAVSRVPADQEIVLIECGWHANDAIAQAYADAARLACPRVRVVTLDGRNPEARQTAWASADIFCSLSDNIQETFGITPLEAMAASLPVVVSDWDGYKDTVRDGVDGYRIPTLMPSPGMGTELALRHALGVDNYDMYCGHTCSFVSVDIEAAARALGDLFCSSELRRRMGDAGRRRVEQVYDWKTIIPRYESLWQQQNELRAHQGKHQSQLKSWPARLDPFAAFASYPSMLLTPASVVALADENVETSVLRFRKLTELKMVNFAEQVLVSKEESEALLHRLSPQATAVREILQGVEISRQRMAFRSLVWLAKLGILRVFQA